MKKKNFSLMEMLIVMAIMMLLFTIGVVAFGKAGKKSEIVQCKAEIAQLKSAIESYRDRWGSYPIQSSGGALDFIAHLSKVEVGDDRFGVSTDKRPMFIDFNKAGFDIDTDAASAYDDVGTLGDTSALDGFEVLDPWGVAYNYYLDSASDNFIIFSAGPDGQSVTGVTWTDGIPEIAPDEDTSLDPRITSNGE